MAINPTNSNFFLDYLNATTEAFKKIRIKETKANELSSLLDEFKKRIEEEKEEPTYAINGVWEILSSSSKSDPLKEAELVHKDYSAYREALGNAEQILQIICNHAHIVRKTDISVYDFASTLFQHMGHYSNSICIYRKRRIIETQDPEGKKHYWLLLNRTKKNPEFEAIGSGGEKKFVWGINLKSLESKAIGRMKKNKNFERQIQSAEKIREAIKLQKSQGQLKPVLEEFVVDVHSYTPNEYQKKNYQSKVAIVQEYISGGDLFHNLYSNNSTSKEKWEFFLSLIEGVMHLHNIGIYIRDIKEENFLRDLNAFEKPLKISDFDLTCFKEDSDDEKMKTHGTIPFMSPHYMDGNLKDNLDKQDVWALGLIFYRMITVDDLPWGGCHTQDSMIASIRRHCATQASIDKWFDKEMKKDEQAGKLIYQMLAADPDQRPSLEVLHKQVTENKEVIKKSFIKLADELGYE